MPGPDYSQIVAELARAVNELARSQGDGLRSLSNIGASLTVVLNKLDGLEKTAYQLEEKTKKLDATHYDSTDETLGATKNIVDDLKELKSIVKSIQDEIDNLPDTDNVRNIVTSILHDNINEHPPIDNNSIKIAMKESLDELRSKHSDIIDNAINSEVHMERMHKVIVRALDEKFPPHRPSEIISLLKLTLKNKYFSLFLFTIGIIVILMLGIKFPIVLELLQAVWK